MNKYIITVLACVLATSALIGQTVRTRIMSFENPGNRRILKTESVNQWYYRSLPERTMKLNVE